MRNSNSNSISNSNSDVSSNISKIQQVVVRGSKGESTFKVNSGGESTFKVKWKRVVQKDERKMPPKEGVQIIHSFIGNRLESEEVNVLNLFKSNEKMIGCKQESSLPVNEVGDRSESLKALSGGQREVVDQIRIDDMESIQGIEDYLNEDLEELKQLNQRLKQQDQLSKLRTQVAKRTNEFNKVLQINCEVKHISNNCKSIECSKSRAIDAE